MPKKTHIRWTDEEQQKVAEAIAAHLLNNPGSTLPQAYDSVKCCLPAERRRTLAAAKQFEPMLLTIMELMQPKPQEKTTELKLVPKTVYIPCDLRDVDTDDLQAELHRRQLRPIMQEIADIVTSKVMAAMHVKEPKVKNKDKKKHPRILVVGLLPEQQQEVSAKFKGVFDMRYVKDESTQVLKDRCKGADEIVLMTKFISHNQQDVVKKNGHSFCHCNGAVSELCELLEASFFHENES